jgi:hypothetical protein
MQGLIFLSPIFVGSERWQSTVSSVLTTSRHMTAGTRRHSKRLQLHIASNNILEHCSC